MKSKSSTVINGLVPRQPAKKANRSFPAWGWTALGIGALLAANAIYRERTKLDLRGKVVLITGGSRGLGLILAKQLAQLGARIAICARSNDQLMNAKLALDELGADVLPIQADLTDRARITSMMEEIIQHFGTLDILINNAGIIQVGPQDALTDQDFEEAFAINFWAPLHTSLEAIEHFKKSGGGSIVNITSIGGKIAVPHLLPYTASKFALVGLSEGLQAELKQSGIHVTTVVPYLMRTGSARNITVKGNHEAEYAWFKISGSNTLLSQNAEVAARRIIKAIQYRESEVVLSVTGKLITLLKGFAPGWVNLLMKVFNDFLPENIPGGEVSKKGYESESGASRNMLTESGDAAAARHNELN